MLSSIWPKICRIFCVNQANQTCKYLLPSWRLQFLAYPSRHASKDSTSHSTHDECTVLKADCLVNDEKVK